MFRDKPTPQFDNTGNGSLQVPGIGLPTITELKRGDRFRHGVADFQPKRLVAVEIAMLAIMDSITEKQNWQSKVFEESIVEKWRSEAIAMPLMSPKAWDWVLKELREKADFLKKRGFITTLDSASSCAKADGLIDERIRDELIAGIAPLLNVDDKDKDWHPNSNQQVLNLVHPSLFPLVYGRTQVLQDKRVGLLDCLRYCGQGVVPPQQDLVIKDGRNYGPSYGQKKDERFSSRFQWLPAEAQFKGANATSGDVEVELTSYINNLHPIQHRGLYSTISKIIGKAIPMWNEVLVKGWNGRIPPRINVREVEEKFGIPEHLTDLSSIDPDDEKFGEALEKVIEYLALPDRPGLEESGILNREYRSYKDGTWKDGELDEYALEEAVSWKFNRIREAIHPEPGDQYSYEEWKNGISQKRRQETYCTAHDHSSPVLKHEYQGICLQDEFRDRGLQVIVKLASVELTPENPSYDGGSWHLEGMLNEHIVATAIYYYDFENITESHIAFRTAADLDSMEISYEQDEHEPIAQVFDVPSLRDELAVQQLGNLKCKEDRLLAFPNTLQHRVEPFKLVDPSRPGHRRFLVLWLVDPNYRIASTANVPPQQHDWIARETIDKILARQDMAAELEDMIKEYTDDYPMSLDTAKKLRLELMKERTTLMPHVENNIGVYNFCEH